MKIEEWRYLSQQSPPQKPAVVSPLGKVAIQANNTNTSIHTRYRAYT